MSAICEKIQIQPAAPFDFQKSLQFIKGFPATQHEQFVGGNSLRKGLRIQHTTVAYELTNVGTIDAPCLELTLQADKPIDDQLSQAIEDRIRFFLSLDDDLSEFYELAKQDDIFTNKVLPQFYGYRHVKFPSPFENAMWAVLAQRQAMAQSRQMKRSLIEYYSEPLTINEQTYHAFPEVADFLSIDPEMIAQLIGHERKSEYLRHVLEAFANISDDFLKNAPYEDVKQWLLNIKGIGEWSAIFVLVRGLGRMEQALTDAPNSRFNQTMLKTAQRIYGPISFGELQAKASYYRAWQGYWTHLLKAAYEIR